MDDSHRDGIVRHRENGRAVESVYGKLPPPH
jgi:hypothetical protein